MYVFFFFLAVIQFMLPKLLKFLGLFSPFQDIDIHFQWKYVVMQY